MCVHYDTASAEGEIGAFRSVREAERILHKERGGGGRSMGGQHHGGRLPFVLKRKEKGMSKSAEIIRCSRVLAGGKGWRGEGALSG